MLKRKITKEIDDWYRKKNNALLIDGARQTGKTTAIENYLNDNGLDYLEINLLENSSALEAFNTSKSSDQLLLRISALSNKPLTAGTTVIFIDEIQEADDAITPIKFLVQDGRYRFVFTGSLLGVKLQNITSIPVGFLQIIQMYPLDFEEFITAFAVSEDTIQYLKVCYENRKPVDSIIHEQMMTLFNLYLTIGGMPKAVQTFIDSKDISTVNGVLADIDSGYRLDISKYNKKEALLIQDIYDLVPSELNNNNKRFIIKDLNEKARFYKYESSFAWLVNSGVGLFVYNAYNPVYPLLASKERTLFKLFLCDVGLLSFKLFSGTQIQILNGHGNLNKGAIYEAVVAQELKAHGFALFYNNDKKRGEIDFLVEDNNNNILPIEVKSGKDYKRHSAMTQLLSNEALNIHQGIILCNDNISIDENRIYLPVYMSMFIKKNNSSYSQKVDIDISKLINWTGKDKY